MTGAHTQIDGRKSATAQGGRQAARGVSIARHRLVNGTDAEPDFEHDLNLMFVRNELAAQGTLLFLAVIFSLASMFWAHWSQAVVWLALVIGAKVLLLELCRRYVATPAAEIDLKFWRRRLMFAEGTNGAVWAGFALVGSSLTTVAPPAVPIAPAELLSAGAFSSHVFVFASLIVVLAIRMTLASPRLPILYIGTIPLTVAVVARLVLQGDFFYLALASMAVGVHVYFVFLAKGLNATAVQLLRFRAQKDDLIAELEEAKAISDVARLRAEEANVAKSRFLATMSHELRTPLNAILGFSEVMHAEIMGPIENKVYKEYAGNIHQSGSHLLHLINEILDLSRIEAGRYDLNESAVRLVDIVDDCHRLLKLRLEGKALRIVEELDDTLPPMWVGERALRQVFLNLLSNAFKFTPRGGEITLCTGRLPDGGQFMRVRDTGPGIPKDEIPKVMEAFGQGSLAHQTAEGGTGLGLPIVKNLVELHGGRFELTSELRKGTVVTAYFPAKRVLEQVPPLQPLGQERHRPVDAPTPVERQLAQPVQASPPVQPTQQPAPTQPAAVPIRASRPSRLKPRVGSGVALRGQTNVVAR
jgi:two-component system cell cycle sensor histidine kinase PleC